MSFPVCLGAVPEDVRVRALAAGRADEDAVSLVPGSFEVGYVAGLPDRGVAVGLGDRAGGLGLLGACPGGKLGCYLLGVLSGTLGAYGGGRFRHFVHR